ncbi:MAG: hypothetical protein QOH48_2167 [Actinomycetota bacterium]|nr:hypothetical protein [Actinomycetota bacterium]
MIEKRYSVAEANALLPHLAPALVELRERYEEAVTIRELVGAAAASNGWTDHKEEWSRTLARVDELIERIQTWNVLLRDVSTGLVDFPTVLEGKDAYLCWRLGEPEVAFWHFADRGFSGRMPL